MNLTPVLRAYQLDATHVSVAPLGTGLINHTWRIKSNNLSHSYVLQRINTSVFKRPEDIAYNIQAMAAYLQEHYPGYLFVAPVKTIEGDELYVDKELGYFRLFPFVEQSRTYDVVSTTSQASEAAHQFALFTRLVSGLDASSLKTTLPDFHNLTLRFEQFIQALNTGNQQRILEAKETINYLLEQQSIADTFKSISNDPQFKIRVMHHDTKISNVLFDQQDKGLCVIDLDTVMPGYFISDVGDMMRTYLSPVSEEEKDVSKIEVRDDYFFAIVEGYLSEMGEELSEAEKAHFIYAGKFMIYMQALRFLTDYINNDVYYGSSYEGHNLVRAKNQAVLLLRLIEKEEQLSKKLPSFSEML